MWRRKKKEKSTPYTSVHLLREKKKYTSRLHPSTTVGSSLSFIPPLSAIGLFSLIALLLRVTAASSFVPVGHDLMENDRVEIHCPHENTVRLFF
jgi:hypothetical protein